MTPAITDRLDALRRELQNREAFAVVDVGPPLTEAKIAEIEANLGLSLPVEYRTILAELGPFDDDTGFRLQLPRRTAGRAGEFSVSRERVLAFARDRLAAATALEHGGRGIGSERFDSVIDKRVLSYGMLDEWTELRSDGPGLVPVADLDGVSADLYLVVGGELRGTVWFDGDCGFHPEFYLSDGDIELHDTLSWALSFSRV